MTKLGTNSCPHAISARFAYACRRSSCGIAAAPSPVAIAAPSPPIRTLQRWRSVLFASHQTRQGVKTGGARIAVYFFKEVELYGR